MEIITKNCDSPEESCVKEVAGQESLREVYLVDALFDMVFKKCRKLV